MSKFKFNEAEKATIGDLMYALPTDRIDYFIAEIEQILSERDEPSAVTLETELAQLLEMAERMQNLYRNGRFGLSDEEMARAVAHLDDLRRIPSPPKQ